MLLDKIKALFSKWGKKALVVFTGASIALAAPTAVNEVKKQQLPDNLKLDAPQSRIINYSKVSTSTVRYAMVSESTSAKWENEVNRTNSTITQKNKDDKYVVTSFLGQRFYRPDRESEWRDVAYSTTTQEAFELQAGNIVEAADTGFNDPGTAVNDDSIGTVAWNNPGNVMASDNSYAETDMVSGGGSDANSNYLKATNFGLSVPSGATVDGIEVQGEQQDLGSGAGSSDNNEVKIVKSDGSLGTENKASEGTYPNTESYQTYGGSNDLWSETWSPADVNNSNFGVVFSATLSPGSLIQESAAARIDHIRIKVYYTASAGEVTPQSIYTF